MNQSVRLSVADGAALYAGPDVAAFTDKDRVARIGTTQGLPIAIRDLRKSFGDHEVLRGIDLDIAAGEFVAIVGRSGCGKSTLLRLIAGLDTPTSGRIALGDGAASNRSALRVMFQEPRLLPWARVRANVEVGLAGNDASLANEALSEVGLADKADQWPAILSGGQRQRVALARALVSRPRVLLFDEPLGALDALTRIHMQHLLEKVWREQGFSAVLVTHDVTEAVALADRVIVLEEGRITEDFKVTLPRPRLRGDADAATLEGAILERLLNTSDD